MRYYATPEGLPPSIQWVDKNSLTEDELSQSFVITSDCEGNKTKGINKENYILAYFEKKPEIVIYYFKNVDLETDHETYMKLILNKRIANQYRRKEKLLNYNKKVFNALQRILDV